MSRITVHVLIKVWRGIIDDVELFKDGEDAEYAFLQWTGIQYDMADPDEHPEEAEEFQQGEYGDSKIFMSELEI